MTTRLFSSKDAGAPQINLNAGDFITVLRACLVDGYGSRTPQGWTMPFSDLPLKGAFQTVGGNDLIRVSNPDYRYAHINGYASMTDIDTGTEVYPNNSEDLSANYFWRTGLVNSLTTYPDWYLIADDEWFYFSLPQDSLAPSDSSGFFFGQYECIESTFTGNYLISGHQTTETSTSAASVENGLYLQSQCWGKRDYRNVAGKRLNAVRDYESVNYQFPNRLSGNIIWEKVKIRSNNITPYDYYGTYPKYYRAMMSVNFDLISGDKITINGVNHIQFTQSSNVIAIEYDVDVG